MDDDDVWMVPLLNGNNKKLVVVGIIGKESNNATTTTKKHRTNQPVQAGGAATTTTLLLFFRPKSVLLFMVVMQGEKYNPKDDLFFVFVFLPVFIYTLEVTPRILHRVIAVNPNEEFFAEREFLLFLIAEVEVSVKPVCYDA